MKMSVEEIVTEISMSYSHAVHVVVEGETDLGFFLSVFKNNSCVNVVCGGGADTVIDVIEIIDKEKASGKSSIKAIGIIDRDYRIPLGIAPSTQNILLTDLRDLECMMINSPCVISVLNELGSPKKLVKFGGVSVVLSVIKSACSVVGSLRYFSHSDEKYYSFQRLDYEKFTDKKTFAIDENKFISHLAGSQLPGNERPTDQLLTDAKIKVSVAVSDTGIKYFTDDLLLCRGHDLMALIAIGLRSLWGSRTAKESTADIIEGYFRVGYLSHFRSTLLFKDILLWLKAEGLQAKIQI